MAGKTERHRWETQNFKSLLRWIRKGRNLKHNVWRMKHRIWKNDIWKNLLWSLGPDKVMLCITLWLHPKMVILFISGRAYWSSCVKAVSESEQVSEIKEMNKQILWTISSARFFLLGRQVRHWFQNFCCGKNDFISQTRVYFSAFITLTVGRRWLSLWMTSEKKCFNNSHHHEEAGQPRAVTHAPHAQGPGFKPWVWWWICSTKSH